MSKRRYPINPEEWIHFLSETRGEAAAAPLKTAVGLYDSKNQAQLEKGLGIADILLALGLDNETLASAVLYPLLQANEIHIDSVAECLGESSGKLLQDVMQMRLLGKLQQFQLKGSHQIENLRKMLLAMVTDVRAVLLVLAERLWELRHSKHIDSKEQKLLADETLSVYAPLANRLGVWQLKWEIEDLCLRYSHPEIYTEIAKGIASRRDDREAYIQRMVKILNDTVTQAGIKDFQVKGRVKHIYSIYKKMQRKNANLEQIYDMSAIRILVQTVDDCYAVLGVLQNGWQQLPEEFDDYIMHPKPNGYRSIHTVLLGPENHFVEVQIRTYQMHQESELGVAAHWRYKEGVLQTSNYEAKIALLRQIIEWQKEVVYQDEVKAEQPIKDLFADRIYVFTPIGDIVDLPKGATPLDFAYLIHSEVGHRCRGAKVDGNIVPLTYELQMGQRVEILTAKLANPSRDWLNPQLGYLKSPRARAKVQHWFRVKDSMKHAVNGRELLDKELRRLGISNKTSLNKVAVQLNYKSDDEMLAALAAGEIRMAQIIHHLLPSDHVENVPVIEARVSGSAAPNIHILGMNNLLTHIARCCKPLPGDSVVGYVTRNRGVSIHRRDCSNMRNLSGEGLDRVMEVNWGDRHSGAYPADLLIRVYDRPGLLRDMTTMLASEKINVLGLQTQKVNDSPEVDIYLTIEIANRQQLKVALEQIQKLPNIIEVRRR
ncbi:GTP pyrophosphokinase [Aquicella siphonis]|uniref:GTP pyrophosphokinase n=1 Tax=Aquicella siphonis TaxID=254247 RepID=A0A5E4PLN7_9COXI|nr:bifunctional (p)ppGpp synthetase/guanosine-3',5'-bis(diphosphate) 3'-pyrophosphohydrolase [Aquicella siphonis]VVC77223.1 GTP pyrophosphokinase [Aquicella siphonis]